MAVSSAVASRYRRTAALRCEMRGDSTVAAIIAVSIGGVSYLLLLK